MNGEIRSNITQLLRQALTAIRKGDSFRLKEISNENVRSAFVFQDEDTLSLSVAVYALAKIIDHTGRKKSIIDHLNRAISALASSKDDAYRAIIRSLIRTIEVEDYKLKRFVSSIVEQAQVKKGCALCESGLSIGRVASILGVSRWELTKYLGKTHIAEQSSEVIPTERRLAIARRIFS